MKKFHFNFYPAVLEFVLSRREEILSEKTGFDGCLRNGFLRISTAESIFIFVKRCVSYIMYGRGCEDGFAGCAYRSQEELAMNPGCVSLKRRAVGNE